MTHYAPNLRPSHSAGLSGFTAAALLALATMSLGCSELLDGEEPQCETSSDCGARGFAGAVCQASRCVAPQKHDDTPWGCVGNVKWDPPDTSRKLIYRATYRRLFTDEAVVGAPVSLCGRIDSTCERPLGTTDTNAEGRVEMDVFYGFDGYTLVTPPPGGPELMRALLLVTVPIFEDVPKERLIPAPLVTADELNQVSQLLGAPINPLEGHVLAATADCQESSAPNVVLSTSALAPDTVPYYYDGGLPSKTAAETDAEGFGGFLNIPPGFVTITASAAGVGVYGVVTVPVLANHVTYVGLLPSPLDGGG